MVDLLSRIRGRKICVDSLLSLIRFLFLVWICSFLCIILLNCLYWGTTRLMYPLTQFFLSANMTAVSSDKLDTFCNPIYRATFAQQWLSELCCIISRQVATSFSSAVTADVSTPLQHAVTTAHTRYVAARLAGTAWRRYVPEVYQYKCNNSVPTAQWTELRPIGSNHCARLSVLICFPWLALYLNCERMRNFYIAYWWLVECYNAVPNKSLLLK